ncbi:AVN_collapsed_G0000060.mRNA.1.CDS.1 [Saccharomyces cerevisiae]|nr:AVN_collapsed_G0000060.mRNA.1.CDS.1 [Saccharomyces cerevisiae]
MACLYLRIFSKNSLTWKFYESFKFLAFRTWVILWLLPSLCWIMSSKWVYSFMISLFVLFFEPIFLPVIHSGIVGTLSMQQIVKKCPKQFFFNHSL